MRARIDEKLAAAGLSGEARDWVIKALDPASDGPAPGIPDTTSVMVLRPEYEVRVNIPGPSVPGPWDCYIYIPPGDVNTLYWAAAPSPANFAAGPTSLPSNSTTGSVQLQPGSYPAGYSAVQLVAATPITVNVSTSGPANLASTFRHQYKSVTIDLIAADISNQGDVFAGQFPTTPRTERFQSWNTTNTGSPGNYQMAGNVTYVALPYNEADLTLACRNAYVGKAKDGVYMPLRMVGPTQDFADVRCSNFGSYNAAPALGPVGMFLPENCTNQWPKAFFTCQNDVAGEAVPQTLGTTISDSWVNYASLGGVGWTGPWSGDTGYDNVATGVVIFRGLSGSSSGSGPSFSAQLLVKVKAGLEVVSRPTSVDRVYAKPPAKYDSNALKTYYQIANELGVAYPSSYNALGALLPVISSLASSLWPTVKAGLMGARTGIADALAPYATRSVMQQPTERVVVKERVVEPAVKLRSPSIRSKTSVLSKKAKRRSRKARAAGLV